MSWCLLRFFYSLVFTLSLPAFFCYLWIRGIDLPIYRDRWPERLGNNNLPVLKEVIWVHAVSVGEVMSALPLVKQLQVRYPSSPIVFTTVTPTGSERVQAAFKEELGKTVFHCYLPYDLPWSLGKLFNKLQIKILVIMETELWPNLLEGCRKRHIPIVIANGRLSPDSFARYQKVAYFTKKMVQPISTVAAQSALDAMRFRTLGVSPERVVDTGNIKFDISFNPRLKELSQALRAQLGERLVWIAASTHEAEEEVLLRAYQALKKQVPSLLLLLVPRHPDRFNKVAQLAENAGLKIIRRSQNASCAADTDVFLGDSMGELMVFYGASDVAYMGGTWVPVGGHNLLEPAALGLPIVSGPQLFNFIAISQMLVDQQALTVVDNEPALQTALLALLTDSTQRRHQGEAGKKVLESNRGALEKLLTLIAQQMP